MKPEAAVELVWGSGDEIVFDSKHKVSVGFSSVKYGHFSSQIIGVLTATISFQMTNGLSKLFIPASSVLLRLWKSKQSIGGYEIKEIKAILLTTLQQENPGSDSAPDCFSFENNGGQ